MKISELILQTNNIEETEKFYSQVLGFKISKKLENSISFLVGFSIITFIEAKKSENPIYHFAFNIPGNKIDDALLWISNKTAILESEDGKITNFDTWNAKSIYFYDNNKNILEFISRKDLNINSEKEFSVESILNISEVGIATENPIELSQKIIDKTGIDFFSKGPKREDFAVVGNENGLFVISNTERNWYPTELKAEKQRTKVKIKANKKEYELEFHHE